MSLKNAAARLRTSGWYVPDGLAVDAGDLVWDVTRPFGPEDSEPATVPLLDAFVRLEKVESDRFPAVCLAFARTWGVLSVCDSHGPGRHPALAAFLPVLVPPPGREPLYWWRENARRVAAWRRIIRALKGPAGVASAEDWQLGWPMGGAGWAHDSARENDEQRMASMLSSLMRSEHVHPLIAYRGGLFEQGYAVEGLTGALVVELARELAGPPRCMWPGCNALAGVKADPPLCARHRNSNKQRRRRERLKVATGKGE